MAYKKRGFLTRIFREPSSIAGAAVAALAGPDVAGALFGLQSAPEISSPEFAQALAVVIAGLLAMLISEKGDGSDA